MIACAFPPTGGSGVQRPAKFAKYLAGLGWEVDVWSGHNLPGLPRDESLLADLPAGVTRLGLNVWNLYAPDQESLPRRLASKVLRLLSYPDERLEWVLRSLHPLYRRLQRCPVDVIVATYSPPSNLILAWCISRLTGTPWIADFRDLWTDDCTYAPCSRLRRRMDAKMENGVLRSADAVVAVSTGQTRILASHVPLQPDKFHTITNGFDFQDFSDIQMPPVSTASASEVAAKRGAGSIPARPREHRDWLWRGDSPKQRMILTHVGRLERQRFTGSILEGFRRFAANHPEEARRLRLLLVGHVNPGLLGELQKCAIEVVATGALEHAAAVECMTSSDWLLLPTAQGHNADSLIPGKTFEYLAGGRPVWVLGKSSREVWQRVSELHAGRLCDPSAESVAAGLKELVAEWLAGRTPSGCTREAVLPYGRDVLAGRLSQLMESVIAEQKQRHRARRNAEVSAKNSKAEVGVARSCLHESF